MAPGAGKGVCHVAGPSSSAAGDAPCARCAQEAATEEKKIDKINLALN